MRKQLGNVLWGLFFIALGIVFAGNVLDLWQFSIFFDGWWTLFIIVPCLISMVREGVNLGNVIGVLIGVSLLLSAQGLLAYLTVAKLLIPIVLICLGISMMFKDRFVRYAKEIKTVDKDGTPSYTAVFSEQKIGNQGEPFAGAHATAVFGSMNVNLRGAVVTQDCVLHVTTVFGGAEIMVPPNVNVKVSYAPAVFGGIDNDVSNMQNPQLPTLYIKGSCVFGGIEIRY